MQTLLSSDVAKVAGGSAQLGAGAEGGSAGAGFAALLTNQIGEGVTDLEAVLTMAEELLVAEEVTPLVLQEVTALPLEGQPLDEDGNPLPLFPAIAALVPSVGEGEEIVIDGEKTLLDADGRANRGDRLKGLLTERAGTTLVNADAGAESGSSGKGEKEGAGPMLKLGEQFIKLDDGARLDEQSFSRMVQSMTEAGAKGDALKSAHLAKESLQTPFKGDIDVPFGRKGWSEGVGDKLTWLVNNKQQSAELRLNPPHLGTIEVKINMNQDQASLSFVTQHGNVKEALESALPRLREMFEENGVSLADVDVSDQSAAEHEEALASGEEGEHDDAQNAQEDGEAGLEGANGSQTVSIDGVVDTYI
ncbi:flagellar hook-length control protein FliK [Solemya pervernicosa gill symbiont]|nr:flagellar hook-length control protein FliK [Solemya pervernicosa gill symbiont]